MTVFTRRGFINAVAGSAAVALLKPSALFATGKNLKNLPDPSTGKDGSLFSALKNRRSTRAFSTKNLPDQMLSDLLWAAFGVNRPDSGKRTAPSARNQQEIDLYVATADGLYFMMRSRTTWFNCQARISGPLAACRDSWRRRR